jgi:hypothetical protein
LRPSGAIVVMSSANSTVPLGTPVHRRGGLVPAPSQVWSLASVPPFSNSGLVKVSAAASAIPPLDELEPEEEVDATLDELEVDDVSLPQPRIDIPAQRSAPIRTA